jgi:hypothetical protein
VLPIDNINPSRVLEMKHHDCKKHEKITSLLSVEQRPLYFFPRVMKAWRKTRLGK